MCKSVLSVNKSMHTDLLICKHHIDHTVLMTSPTSTHVFITIYSNSGNLMSDCIVWQKSNKEIKPLM